MSEPTKTDRRDATGYIFLHIFLGPVFANLAILASSLITIPPRHNISMQFNPTAIGDASFVLVGLLLLSWTFGLVPAVLHAATMLILHRLMGTTAFWIALTPLVGWLATWLPMVLLGGTDPRTFTDGAYMALVGSAAALGCLAIAWARNIYPVRTKQAG